MTEQLTLSRMKVRGHQDRD